MDDPPPLVEGIVVAIQSPVIIIRMILRMNIKQARQFTSALKHNKTRSIKSYSKTTSSNITVQRKTKTTHTPEKKNGGPELENYQLKKKHTSVYIYINIQRSKNTQQSLCGFSKR